MIIKKLSKNEIQEWLGGNMPDDLTPFSVSELFKRFQDKVAKHNLVPKEIVGSIKCLACGKVHKATNIELLDLEYYVQPRGCTDGDYWEHKEYFILCEGCGFALTIPKEDRYKLPATSAKKVNLDRGLSYLQHRKCKIKYKTIYI